MKLTLAMGLQYDPQRASNTGANLLSYGREGLAMPSPPSLEPVIDVEAVAVDPVKTDVAMTRSTTFDYLVYDLRSSLVFLPVIGSQLDMVI